MKTDNAEHETMRDLAADNNRLNAALAQTREALDEERARTALLRRALTETSIELHQARRDVEANTTVTPLPAARQRERTR